VEKGAVVAVVHRMGVDHEFLPEHIEKPSERLERRRHDLALNA
jgi:hypothetical protein